MTSTTCIEQDILILTGKHNLPAFFVHPERNEDCPGVIVIPEIWGVNENIRDVARRIAKEGYNVLAPDILIGTAMDGKADAQLLQDMQDPDKKDLVQQKIRALLTPSYSPEFAADMLQKLRASIDELQKETRGKIAAVGFCFGGTYSFALAADDDRVAACVPFYGESPNEEQVQCIQCPVLALYGEYDSPLMQSFAHLKVTMQKHKKSFEYVIYPQVRHAFFNDQNPRMYNKKAADDSWERMCEFLALHTK